MAKLGSLFAAATGNAPSTFEQLQDIDKAAEQHLRRTLKVKSVSADLVPARGNIFPTTPYGESIDQEIDAHLARMQRECRR